MLERIVVPAGLVLALALAAAALSVVLPAIVAEAAPSYAASWR